MPNNGGIKKGILAVLSANLINLFFNLFINFAQPKFLSVDSYAAIKTFQLFVSYVGIIHIGYIDGMYLRYGGMNFNSVDKIELSRSISTLRVFQFGVEIVCCAVAIALKDAVLLFVALSIMPYNMGSYYKSLFQATGEFKKYGRIMNANTISGFLLNFVLILLIRTDYYVVYIFFYVISYVLIWLYLEKQFITKGLIESNSLFKFDIREFTCNIKKGFTLMLGNFSSTILTSIDRWFVKAFLENASFAYYSFAVSMENFLNLAITPLTITMYNYFCINKEKHQIVRARNYVTIFAVFLPVSAFPAKFILETFLQKYILSVGVMVCLFAAQTLYIIIKSLYVNLYKVKGLQTVYFKKLLVIILLGIIFNYTFFLVMKNKEAYALATLSTAIVWFVLSLFDFKDIAYNFIQIVHIFTSIMLLIIFGNTLNAILGCTLYLLIIVPFTFLVYREECTSVLKNAIGRLKRR